MKQPLTSPTQAIQKIERIFRLVFDDATMKIQGNTVIAEIEGWDTLVQAQLMRAVEREFSLRFAADEVKTVKTVGELQNFVEKRANRGPG